MKHYRCKVQFRPGNRAGRDVETYTIDAESIKEAAATIRDWFPIGKEGHQGFTIEEVNINGIRPL